jgi:hypothetical protein
MSSNQILTSAGKFVKHKTGYRQGLYWPLTDIDSMRTLDKEIQSSKSIVHTTEWQHQDYIIANSGEPSLAVELTEHAFRYNNVAQRLPRLVRPLSYGVSTAILQKVDERSQDKYKGWFLKALVNASRIFKTPAVSYLYDDSQRGQSENALSRLTCQLVDSISFGDAGSLKDFRKTLGEKLRENEKMADDLYDESELLDSSKWLSVSSNRVEVIIGARPDRKGWKTKGTGNLDPYPGLVLLADLLLCRTGPRKSDRSRKLVVVFKHLPKNFWWFKKFPTELYLELLIDPAKRIADDVVFKG